MATNWCKPLFEWRQLFTQWIRLPEPQALLDAAIFFDFRPVAGSLSLDSLEETIAPAKDERRFLAHMLNGALAFRPPLGFFNRLRATNGEIDIKMGGIAPIVSIARVMGWQPDRANAPLWSDFLLPVVRTALISSESARSLSEIFPFLLRLRLGAQLAEYNNRVTIDNRIDPAMISPVRAQATSRRLYHRETDSGGSSRRLAAGSLGLRQPAKPRDHRDVIRRLFSGRQYGLCIDGGLSAGRAAIGGNEKDNRSSWPRH